MKTILFAASILCVSVPSARAEDSLFIGEYELMSGQGPCADTLTIESAQGGDALMFLQGDLRDADIHYYPADGQTPRQAGSYRRGNHSEANGCECAYNGVTISRMGNFDWPMHSIEMLFPGYGDVYNLRFLEREEGQLRRDCRYRRK